MILEMLIFVLMILIIVLILHFYIKKCHIFESFAEQNEFITKVENVIDIIVNNEKLFNKHKLNFSLLSGDNLELKSRSFRNCGIIVDAPSKKTALLDYLDKIQIIYRSDKEIIEQYPISLEKVNEKNNNINSYTESLNNLVTRKNNNLANITLWTNQRNYLLSFSYYDRLVSGLYFRVVNGYMNDNSAYFQNKIPIRHGIAPHINSIDVAISGWDSYAREKYSVEFIGFFKTTDKAKYSFCLNSDDCSYMWVGQTAFDGYNTNNALVRNPYLHGMQRVCADIELEANSLYPVRVQFGENGGGDNLILEIFKNGTLISNIQAYLFAYRLTNDEDYNLFIGSVQSGINMQFYNYYIESTKRISNPYKKIIVNNMNDINNHINIKRNQHSATFDAKFRPTYTGNYTFSLSSDDASYLWISPNNISIVFEKDALVKNGNEHATQEVRATTWLDEGVTYNIKVFFGNNFGDGSFSFKFNHENIKERSDCYGFFFQINENVYVRLFNVYMYNIPMLIQNEKDRLTNIDSLGQKINDSRYQNVQLENEIQDMTESLNREKTKNPELERNILKKYLIFRKFNVDKILDVNYTSEQIQEIEKKLNYTSKIIDSINNDDILPILGWQEIDMNNDWFQNANIKNISDTKADYLNWNACYRNITDASKTDIQKLRNIFKKFNISNTIVEYEDNKFLEMRIPYFEDPLKYLI